MVIADFDDWQARHSEAFADFYSKLIGGTRGADSTALENKNGAGKAGQGCSGSDGRRRGL
jgi:hypothetical protein